MRLYIAAYRTQSIYIQTYVESKGCLHILYNALKLHRHPNTGSQLHVVESCKGGKFSRV